VGFDFEPASVMDGSADLLADELTWHYYLARVVLAPSVPAYAE